MNPLKSTLLTALLIIGSLGLAIVTGLIDGTKVKDQILGKTVYQYKSVPLQKKLRISQNPVYLPKQCSESHTVSFNIIRPSKISNDYRLLIYIDEELYVEERTDQINFHRAHKGQRISGSKWFDIDMPTFQDVQKESATLRAAYFSGDELIESIEVPMNYIEDGQTVTIAQKRKDTPFAYTCGQVQQFANQRSLPFLEPGEYRNNLVRTRTITRTADHFLVDYSIAGNRVYKDENSSPAFLLPAIEPLQMKVPLRYDLAEGTQEMPTLGVHLIENEYVGKQFGYKYDSRSIGYEQIFRFEDCNKVVAQEDCMNIPSSFDLALLDLKPE